MAIVWEAFRARAEPSPDGAHVKSGMPQPSCRPKQLPTRDTLPDDNTQPCHNGVVMRAEDEAALLRACRERNPEAWETLVRRYQRLIYAVPIRAGLSDDLAGEVFQRVCVKLLEHIDRIEQPERIGAWLTTTARRESWRQLRLAHATTSLSQAVAEEDELMEMADPELLPDEALERLERQHVVRRAFAELDERCRTLLSLLFYRAAPPPYAEIAAALGVPEGSVGPTRARCLQKLQRLLEAEEL